MAALADESDVGWDVPEDVPDGVDRLVVDVAGFEGPLDVLLALARTQKVDLTRISVSALADQYLAFVAEARRRRLDLAADYLVMAAWLAYLKSRLLLPKEAPEAVDAQEAAAALAWRLKRLEAIRDVLAKLDRRALEGRDVFYRGAEEPAPEPSHTGFRATLHDLVKAYAARRQKDMVHTTVRIVRRDVWTLADARLALRRLLGGYDRWIPFEALVAAIPGRPASPRSVRASSFSAALEMAREGEVDLHQRAPFAPLSLRPRPAGPDGRDGETGIGTPSGEGAGPGGAPAA